MEEEEAERQQRDRQQGPQVTRMCETEHNSNQRSVISVQLADKSSKHFLYLDSVVGQLLGINLS